MNLHTHYVLIHAYLNTPYVQSFDKYLLDENIFVIKYVILVEGPQRVNESVEKETSLSSKRTLFKS